MTGPCDDCAYQECAAAGLCLRDAADRRLDATLAEIRLELRVERWAVAVASYLACSHRSVGLADSGALKRLPGPRLAWSTTTSANDDAAAPFRLQALGRREPIDAGSPPLAQRSEA